MEEILFPLCGGAGAGAGAGMPGMGF